MIDIQCPDGIFRGVEAVIFDKDGTLADSHTFLWQLGQTRIDQICKRFPEQVATLRPSLQQAFGIQTQTINPAGLLAVGTRRENEIAAATYITASGQDWVTALSIARDAFKAADRSLGRKADHTPPFDGTVDILKQLKSTGLKVGILSADTTSNVQDFVQRYDLAPYLQLQQGTDEGLSKPDPRLFWQACERLGRSPDKTLMVGDSNADLQLAYAAGAAGCVAVHWGWLGAAALEAAIADLLTRSFPVYPIEHFNQIQICQPG